MIIRMDNKSEHFYAYLGKLFGSRSVESFTRDRIYDDSHKEWYVYCDKDKPSAFVSVSGNKIKNVYSDHKKFLVAVLKEVKAEKEIGASIVTKVFLDQYKEAGFMVRPHSANFVEIRGVEHV